MGSDSPLNEGYNAVNVEIEGRGNTDLGGDVRIYRHRVIPGYLAATQIPLMKGRDFTDQDIAGSTLVGIISDSMARRYWPSEDPIGKRIRIRSSNGPGPMGFYRRCRGRCEIPHSDRALDFRSGRLLPLGPVPDPEVGPAGRLALIPPI